MAQPLRLIEYLSVQVLHFAQVLELALHVLHEGCVEERALLLKTDEERLFSNREPEKVQLVTQLTVDRADENNLSFEFLLDKLSDLG